MNTPTTRKMPRTWQWFVNSLTNHASFAAYFEPLIQVILSHWRADKIRGQVQGIRHENEHTFSLVIKPSAQWQGFKAGQYIELTVEKNGAWMSRYFSISSSPVYFTRTGLIELTIRIQDKGKITPWLPDVLHRGSVVNLSQAMGDFTLNPEHSSVCMIAGGSGITPFRAMLQQLNLGQQHHNKQDITLLYYARSAHHFLFEDAFTQFKQQNPNFHLRLIDSERHGHITAAHISLMDHLQSDTHFYVCGPSPMILLARTILSGLNIQASNVHYEFFGPEPLHQDLTTESTAVLFQRSNKQVSSDQNQTLLTLAEDNQLTPISGCRMGVCHQCICQKKSGVVYNTKSKTYSDTGAQEIQLCINIPVNDVVLDL